jgi:uncharacterized membrane protein
MNKTRLEAFSDGVLAIIITIMVLEIKVPHTADWHALVELLPVFLSYMLSFVFLGVYWNNHHHLLHTVKQVNSRIMWSNLNLLFWLSLLPFGTAWMGENCIQQVPVIIYASLLIISGVSYDILRKSIMKTNQLDDAMKTALGKQEGKALISTVCYALAIPASFLNTYLSVGLFVLVAIMWVVPSREIERSLQE